MGLHVLVDGPPDAPPVLLLHSLGATASMWEPQLASLTGRYRVIRPDLRGHGRSPAPAGPYTLDELADDVVGVLDQFGIASAHLVGISLGGMIALRLAAHHPKRVGTVVLLCTSARLGPPEQWDQRAATARTEGVGALAETVASRWLTPGYARAHPEAHESLVAMIAATPAQGYAGCCAAIRDMDQRADLPAIAAPTLVIAGADDPAIPPDHGALIATEVPGARFAVVPDGAHLVSYQRPEAVNPLILEALDG